MILMEYCELKFFKYSCFNMTQNSKKIGVSKTYRGVRQSTPSDVVEWQDGPT